MPLRAGATYDAIVVGAGPAGAHLAYLLARSGRHVALLDKARFPRDKVCGGGLSRKALALLDFDITRIAHRWVSGAFLTFQNRSAVVKDLGYAAGCMVLRRELDQALLDRACRAGADYFGETAFLDLREQREDVVVATSRGPLRGRRLFAADGVASAVRRKVFGRDLVEYVPVLEALVELPQPALAGFGERVVFDFGSMRNGYAWIFPKRDHLNVGVYAPFGGTALTRQLSAFLERYPALRQRRRLTTLGYAIPLRNRRDLFERGRVALLGDAAGLVECVFGEGIYFALKSATLAARAEIARARGEALGYTQLLRRELLPELRAARLLAKGLYTFPEFAFRHLVCNDRINRLFAGLIAGDTGYRECLVKSLLAAPAWIMRHDPPQDWVIS